MLLSGAAAGIIATFLTYPLDLLRANISKLAPFPHNQMQIRGRGIKTARQLFRQGGVSAFYKGCGVACFGVAPYYALKMTVFNYLRFITAANCQRNYYDLLNLVLGAVSGTLAFTFAYPLEFIRRQLQIGRRGGQNQTYSAVLNQTFKKYGIRGFYKGMAAGYFEIIPGIALLFMCNERLKSLYFQKEHQE